MKNKYSTNHRDKEVTIELFHRTLGKIETIVDIGDFDKVNSIKTTWFVSYSKGHIDGVKTKIQENGKRKVVWLHRLLLDCPKHLVVDHIDGDTLNNKKNNIRIVDRNKNATNLSSYSKNKSGFTNIYKEKDGKYRVRINGRSFGRHSNLTDALVVRNKNLPKIFPLRIERIMKEGD